MIARNQVIERAVRDDFQTMTKSMGGIARVCHFAATATGDGVGSVRLTRVRLGDGFSM
jgi:hypothetical protein